MSVIHIESADQFKSLLAKHEYLCVDFSAEWCGPCKAIAPMLAGLASKNTIENYMAFVKVDVDEVQELAAEYQISAMPTFMFFHKGQQVAVNGDAMIRGADPRRLTAAVDKVSGLAKAKAESA